MHVAFYSYKTHTTEGLILGLEIYTEDIPIQGLQCDSTGGTFDLTGGLRPATARMTVRAPATCHDHGEGDLGRSG